MSSRHVLEFVLLLKLKIELMSLPIIGNDTMPSDRQSDKGLSTNLNSVIPVPLSRKPFRVLISFL